MGCCHLRWAWLGLRVWRRASLRVVRRAWLSQAATLLRFLPLYSSTVRRARAGAADQVVGRDLDVLFRRDVLAGGGAEGVDLPECVRDEDQEVVEVAALRMS